MYNSETNFDLQLSPERTAEEGACSSCSTAAERTSTKRRNIYLITTLWVINLTMCALLLFLYNDNHSLLVVGFLNLAFTILAAVATASNIPQLIIACVMYKILCGTYLSFLICKLIDTLVAKRSYITREDIWVITAFMCTAIELRLLMSFKTETDDRTPPPPKYSSCALVPSPTNSQLPTYDEALKMIEQQQKNVTKDQNSSKTMMEVPSPSPSSSSSSSSPSSSSSSSPRTLTLSPTGIYTIQNTESTRSVFRDNLYI